MTTVFALAYADWRGIVNGLRRIGRSPARLTLWSVYGLLIALFIWSRARGIHLADARGDIDRADYLVCAYLVTICLSFAFGRGAMGIFRSRAEARFVIGSPVPATAAVAYLQARDALAQALRYVASFASFFFVFAPRALGPWQIVADLVLVIAALIAGAAVLVPRRFASTPVAIACAVAGVALALAIGAPALRDFVDQITAIPRPFATFILTVIPPWHPGSVLMESNTTWVLAMLAFSGLAIAALASVARDAYPELYGMSIAQIEQRERFRARRAGIRVSVTSTRPPRARHARRALPAPPGVLIFVWKSALAYWRRDRPAIVLGGACAWLAVGFIAGRLVTTDNALFATLISIEVNAMVGFGVGASGTFASELRRPLFWLSPATLFARMCALATAQIWRTTLSAMLVGVGFALGGGKLMQTLLLVVGLPALIVDLAGIGFLSVALFPQSMDQRGPLAMLRFLFSYVLFVPPVVLYLVVAAVWHAPLVALGIGVFAALAEGAALLAVAAWRLAGNIDRLPSQG